jgi:hypothetical protein
MNDRQRELYRSVDVICREAGYALFPEKPNATASALYLIEKAGADDSAAELISMVQAWAEEIELAEASVARLLAMVRPAKVEGAN